ncbi:MAG: gamma-glutamyl-gamma-aminobutyrate hydrolase family protein, partial [Gammaproteobacteria bacterium]|nr:gamma-glutamyl-gamma-aminobutyrate hydrolase family protein [Gammaproteobacteria bacterium]MBU1554490.1 gamma-glutamyl-gamma-aminobutyrate hydrolase family protein [Gammaproteobacteria bacterium]
MKILIVDNYDSFTFNLYQYVSEVFAVLPVVVRNDDTHVDFEDYDAIVISPGPGTPNNKSDIGICEQIIKHTSKPLLGICLGHQSIVASLGGTVELSGMPYHGRSSKILHGGSGVFSNLPNPLTVVRYHSLIASQPLPTELIATAFTEDGMIMAIEHRHRPMWGVQFHPESISTDCGRQLIENFKNLVQQHNVNRSSVQRAATEQLDLPQAAVPPVAWRCRYQQLNSTFQPAEVFQRLYGDSQYSFWLDSSSVNNAEARFSFIGDASGPESFWFSYDMKKQTVLLNAHGKQHELHSDYCAFVKQTLAATVAGAEELPFDFCGGLVGF